MGKLNCNEELELKKGPWTREEDQKLMAYIQEHGHGSWRSLPAKAGLERCGKSCRMRWTNYLRPDIKRGKFSTQEEKTIIRLHALLGNRWSSISTHLPKRTDNEIKNYWNTRLKKRLTRMGIDPATHKPKNNPSGSAHSKQAANLSHIAQWEMARLEAEVRLVRESKRLYNMELLRKFRSPPTPTLLRAAPPCLDILKVWLVNNNHTGFFSSTLESPTSTLSFSGNNSTIPTVHDSSFMANDVIPMNKFDALDQVAKGNSYNHMKGKMENSLLVHDNNDGNPFDYDCSISGLIGSSIHDNYDTHNLANAIVGDFEDTRNYWNELLNLVSSPKADLPMF